MLSALKEVYGAVIYSMMMRMAFYTAYGEKVFAKQINGSICYQSLTHTRDMSLPKCRNDL